MNKLRNSQEREYGIYRRNGVLWIDVGVYIKKTPLMDLAVKYAVFKNVQTPLHKGLPRLKKLFLLSALEI